MHGKGIAGAFMQSAVLLVMLDMPKLLSPCTPDQLAVAWGTHKAHAGGLYLLP